MYLATLCPTYWSNSHHTPRPLVWWARDGGKFRSYKIMKGLSLTLPLAKTNNVGNSARKNVSFKGDNKRETQRINDGGEGLISEDQSGNTSSSVDG